MTSITQQKHELKGRIRNWLTVYLRGDPGRAEATAMGLWCNLAARMSLTELKAWWERIGADDAGTTVQGER